MGALWGHCGGIAKAVWTDCVGIGCGIGELMFTLELRNAHIRHLLYAEVIIFAWVLLPEERPREGHQDRPVARGLLSAGCGWGYLSLMVLRDMGAPHPTNPAERGAQILTESPPRGRSLVTRNLFVEAARG